MAAGRGDTEGSLFTQALPTTKDVIPNGCTAAAGKEPAPLAPPPAQNSHSRVTFSRDAIHMALWVGCCSLKHICLWDSDCSSLGMTAARIRGCFWWEKRAGSPFCCSLGDSPVSGITTPSWDSRLHRKAPTCQSLTITGTGWIHPHDPTHAANSPRAFISLSVTVTHALCLPVYRLYSQCPCGSNDRLGETGLLAQILEEKPPEAWEREGKGKEGTPAHWDPSE